MADPVAPLAPAGPVVADGPAADRPTVAGPVDLDAELVALLATPAGRADPYPRYARIREHAPIFRSSIGSWIVTRYADCQQVLRVPHFGKESDHDELIRMRTARWGIPAEEIADFTEFFGRRQSMLTLNPPDHTRLRGLVARAFTPNTVEALRPGVIALCDGLLDTMAERGAGGDAVDVMKELAFPLPVAVIGELLGVPVADRARFQGLVRAATVILEPMSGLEDLRGARASRITMEDYFRDLVAERRRRPAGDLLSELIAVSDGSDRLTEDEVVSTAILLFAAGFETTTNLIGNGLLALLRHPDELSGLRSWVDDATAVQRAVEELLRWDSPVQLDGRTATRDVEMAGQTIRAGENVMTLLGAANRDPRRFRDPERLDLRRDEGPPMSFGSGIHFCLGASLARLEGQVCFSRLLTRFAAIELRGDDVAYRDAITLRGLAELPVGLAAA
ncbi:MAG TPA: cytochrome P450 [Acidimicrobiales bacterium]|nr:cytochrome P450 [Acidimicrobiales bacterium]